jgi:hypothetical protein
MPNPTEDKILSAVNMGVADLAKAKAWYKQYPFYAGLIIGGLVVQIGHWLL